MSAGEPGRLIFVATHHKGGTVWMMTTFIRIAERLGWPFFHLNAGEPGWEPNPDKASILARHIGGLRPDQCAIVHDYYADIPDIREIKRHRPVRGIHLVRDPRDMLLSAVRFHLRSGEHWLDEDGGGWGMTFREKLASYASLEDRVRFEMDTHMGWVFDRMAGFDDQGVFETVRYEDLIVDAQMSAFSALAERLGLRGEEVGLAREAFWASSLFGERTELDVKATEGHIYDGGTMQWKRAMPSACLRLVESRYGELIEGLGYPLSETCNASS